ISHSASELPTINLNLEPSISISISAKLRREVVASFQNTRSRFLIRSDRQNYNMGWRNSRRQDRSVIVAVRHDHGAHHARRHSPARRPGEFLLSFAVLKLNPTGTGKVLSQKMR